MYKGGKKYCATVANGQAKILQGDGSDVSLTISPGSQGVYMTTVNIDHSRFKDIIPSSDKPDCIIGPFVEAEHIGASDDLKTDDLKMHTIKIPHSLRKEKYWKDIKVYIQSLQILN